jgi:hypothetical protein
MPFPSRVLIHTYHAVSLPRPCHSPTVPNAVRWPTYRLWTADANSHIPCRSPAATLPFSECRTRVGRPHAVSGRPMLIHTYHAVPLPRTWRGLERSVSERHICGMGGGRHGMCESNTAALCKSNWKDTI